MNDQDQSIWDRYRQGRIARQIGRELEVSHRLVQNRLNKHGGMKLPERRRGAGRLSFGDREEISCGIAAGLSANSIAERMERPPSTISREIARNGGREAYRAVDAEQAAWDRARRPKPTKLAQDATLRNDVVEGLAKKWSPEQISGRLVVDYPDDLARRISFESIYRAVYLPEKNNLPEGVRICLRSRRRLRRSKVHLGGKNQRRGQLTDITLIAERPTAVDDRREFGHWEGDLVLGTGNSAIATLVERTSRYTEIVKLGGLKSPVVVDAVSAHMQQMSTAVLVTLAWDRGKEMAEHKRLHAETGVPIYFCDPKSPWQRGTNENTNGLLREYFPKRIANLSGLHPSRVRPRHRRTEQPASQDPRLPHTYRSHGRDRSGGAGHAVGDVSAAGEMCAASRAISNAVHERLYRCGSTERLLAHLAGCLTSR